jgi:transcriptional regulator with XRE-family HTH domain
MAGFVKGDIVIIPFPNKMKTILFIVGKTRTGFDAYREEAGNNLIATTGADMAELKANIMEAYNLYLEDKNVPLISLDQITFQYDLPSFFDFYKEINASALGKRIGIHKSLISEYANGKRKPSEKQVKKILGGVKELAKELSALNLA